MPLRPNWGAMHSPWRTSFVQFLVARGVPRSETRFHVFWVDRWLAHPEGFLDATAGGAEAALARSAIGLFQEFQADATDATAGSCRTEWDHLESEMKRILRLQHKSLRTEKAYLGWLRRYRAFVQECPPQDLASKDVERFLSHLATVGKVSASTQNQAFNAVLYLHRHVLRRDIEDLGSTIRAPIRNHIPVVLSRQEVRQVLDGLPYPYGLMARMIYGCGLRLQECLELRIQDVDFGRHVLTVHAGKGDKDRRTMLPESLGTVWNEHVVTVRRLHERDRAEGLPGVALPHALEQKYPNAGRLGVGFGRSPRRRFPLTRVHTSCGATTIIRVRFRSASRRQSTQQGLPSQHPSIRCGTVLRRTCWRTGMTFGRSRSCLATRTCRPR